MTIIIEKDKAKEHFESRSDFYREQGHTEAVINEKLASEYTFTTNIKYSEEDLDYYFNYWYEIITQTQGGYWQFIELMQQPHTEFTHPKTKGQHSYEMMDVPLTHAKKELSPRAYLAYKERFIKKKGGL